MIYLDHAASTPCDPLVIKTMLPYFTKKYANPSNTSNQMGLESNKAVQLARNCIADFLGCLSQQIIWTSGATESNNLALQGSLMAHKLKFPNAIAHIITSAIEHKSVLETCKQLLNNQVEISFISPDENGSIQTEKIEKEIKENTFLVSIMMANNELGVINDLDSISEICQRKKILLHSDATQFFGKIPINLSILKIDFLSFSGHKIYAPKGIGGLFIRNPHTIIPVIYGGGQEEGVRSGTLNVPGIVGISKACQIYANVQGEEILRLKFLRDKFENILLNFNDEIVVNSLNTSRLPNISNISFPVKQGFNLLNILNDKKIIACSSGSACDSPDNKPSHVMKELSKTRHEAKNTLRFSIGRFTTEAEIIQGASHIIEVLKPVI